MSRTWPGYVDQKNYAASVASHDWIFSLDADERVTPALADEIRHVVAGNPAGTRVSSAARHFHLADGVRTTDFYPDPQTRLIRPAGGALAGKVRPRVGRRGRCRSVN
jgi:hypothetical protein